MEKIARRTGKSEREIRTALEAIWESINRSPIGAWRDMLGVQELVKDPDGAVYVATVLYLRYDEGFRQAILVTWNKRDYQFWPLMGHWARVSDPRLNPESSTITT